MSSWYPETNNNQRSYENNILLDKEKPWVYMYVVIKFKHSSWLLQMVTWYRQINKVQFILHAALHNFIAWPWLKECSTTIQCSLYFQLRS